MYSLFERLKTEPKAASPCLFYPVAKEMNLSLSELLTDSNKQKEVLIKIAESYPVSAVIRMTELWCEAAAFGMNCTIVEQDFPKLGAALYTNVDELESAVIPPAINSITEPLIQAVKLAAPRISKPLIVGVTAPYTLGSVLGGSEEFMINCMTEPEIVHRFLKKITAFLVEYILEYKKAGADGIILAEPSIAMISPAMTEEFSNQYIEQMINAVQDDTFSVIYHNCGAVNPHLPVLAKLSVHAFHFGNDVDLSLAFDTIPPDRIIMGNIDPRLFLGENGMKIKGIAEELLAKYSGFQHYICSTGCDLSPNALPQMIHLFLQATLA